MNAELDGRYWLRLIERSDDKTGRLPPAELARVRLKVSLSGLALLDVDLVWVLHRAVLDTGTQVGRPFGGPYVYSVGDLGGDGDVGMAVVFE